MRVVFAFIALCVLATQAAYVPDEWTLVSRAEGSETMRVWFALVQENLDFLEHELMAVSMPKSDRYGQHLTKEEITNIVAPGRVRETHVVSFLKDACTDDLQFEGRGDAVYAEMTVRDVESVFACEVHVYKLKSDKVLHLSAAGLYSIPAEIKADVMFVEGVGGFPYPKHGPRAHDPTDPGGLRGNIVPQSLYSLYNYGDMAVTNPDSTLSLAEFDEYTSFTPSGLARMQEETNLASNPINQSHIVGQYDPSSGSLEALLDTQYGLASARNVTGWYWTTNTWMWSWASDLLAADYTPLVNSVSWGWSEDQQCHGVTGGECNATETSQQYINRTDGEFMKLGANGITIVVCSQDEGAGGSTNSECFYESGDVFNVAYPGSSKYVLSVGATMVENVTVFESSSASLPPACTPDQQCIESGIEVVCSWPDALITSGGGFSIYNPTLPCQQTAVSNYLSSGVTLPPAGLFNTTGRGVPDISASGHSYLVWTDGANDPEQVDGTSCSTPVIAGVMALLNSERLNNGMATLGYVTPLIYEIWGEHSDAFNDVTIGNNKCTEECCLHYGYEAAVGWDPATGVGTPNVQNLASYATAMGKPARVF